MWVRKKGEKIESYLRNREGQQQQRSRETKIERSNFKKEGEKIQETHETRSGLH